MSDFRQNFEVMEVCHLTETLSEPGSRVRPWSCITHHGTWEPGITAGGAANGGETDANKTEMCDNCCEYIYIYNVKTQTVYSQYFSDILYHHHVISGKINEYTVFLSLLQLIAVGE